MELANNARKIQIMTNVGKKSGFQKILTSNKKSKNFLEISNEVFCLDKKLRFQIKS